MAVVSPFSRLFYSLLTELVVICTIPIVCTNFSTLQPDHHDDPHRDAHVLSLRQALGSILSPVSLAISGSYPRTARR